MAQLLDIFIKHQKFEPLIKAQSATLVKNRGIKDNYNQGGKRQVTFLDIEQWTLATERLTIPIDPIERRANFLVKGIDLKNTTGKIIQVGKVQFLVHGETKPCKRMDQICPGLMEVLSINWAGGCYAEVLNDGLLAVGDDVVILL